MSWEFSAELESNNYIRASEMNCIRRQIGCNDDIWNSWTFWFKAILFCVAIGIPLAVVIAVVRLRKFANESRVEVLSEENDLETVNTAEGEPLLAAVDATNEGSAEPQLNK